METYHLARPRPLDPFSTLQGHQWLSIWQYKFDVLQWQHRCRLHETSLVSIPMRVLVIPSLERLDVMIRNVSLKFHWTVNTHLTKLDVLHLRFQVGDVKVWFCHLKANMSIAHFRMIRRRISFYLALALTGLGIFYLTASSRMAHLSTR